MAPALSLPAGAPATATAEPRGQYLTFMLGEELFALDIRSVREIIQCCPMTAVPLMPRFVRGVINLRGAVVPVIDPHARFGRRAAPLGKKSCNVIFEARREGERERVELGLLVDSVSEVIEIGADAIEPAPNFGASVRRDFIRGMGKVEVRRTGASRFVIILEADRAFDVGEMAQLCDEAQHAQAALAA